MTTLAIALLVSVSLFGCKMKNDAIGKLNEFKDQMCKCADKACADKVNDEYTKSMAELTKDSSAKPSEEVMKMGAEVATAYAECMSKAMGAGGDKAADKPADSAAPKEKVKGLPAKCAEYVDLATKFVACPKIGDADKKMTQDGIDSTKSFWTDTDNPDQATKNCSAGIDMLKSQATAAGCTL